MSVHVWILCLGVMVLAGCATVPRTPARPADGIRLSDLCRQEGMACDWDGVSQTATLTYKSRRILVMVGSAEVLLANGRVTLSAPVHRQHGEVIVPPDLQTVLAEQAKLSAQGRAFPEWIGRVIVDAGHGGKDPGALGLYGAKEKDIALDIARRVREGLVKEGVDAVLTRDKDEFLTLAGRTEIASQPGVEIFLSVHANANKNRNARGIEVYYSGPLSSIDLSDDQRAANSRAVIAGLKMDGRSADLRRIVSDMLYARKLVLGASLAERVSRRLSSEVRDNRGRGSKTARFFVLRNTLTPAILVEAGFMTNAREVRLLKDAAYRQKLADVIVDSVVEFLYDPGV